MKPNTQRGLHQKVLQQGGLNVKKTPNFLYMLPYAE